MIGLRRFSRECKGSVAIMFALAIIVVLGAVGAAIDFARAAQRRNQLQGDIDSALLSFSRQSVTLTDAEVEAKIRAYMIKVGYPSGELQLIKVARSGQSLTVTANAVMPTTIMKVLNIHEVKLNASATARWMKAEIVLVLDNSGSMNDGSRLVMLKKAVNDFIDKSAGSDGAMSYGMVPFAKSVRVPLTDTYKKADWIEWKTSGGGSDDDEDDGDDDEDEDDEDDDDDGRSMSKNGKVASSTARSRIM